MTDPVKENIWFINGKYHRESIILQSLKLKELIEERVKLIINGDISETLQQFLEDSKNVS